MTLAELNKILATFGIPPASSVTDANEVIDNIETLVNEMDWSVADVRELGTAVRVSGALADSRRTRGLGPAPDVPTQDPELLRTQVLPGSPEAYGQVRGEEHVPSLAETQASIDSLVANKISELEEQFGKATINSENNTVTFSAGTGDEQTFSVTPDGRLIPISAAAVDEDAERTRDELKEMGLSGANLEAAFLRQFGISPQTPAAGFAPLATSVGTLADNSPYIYDPNKPVGEQFTKIDGSAVLATDFDPDIEYLTLTDQKTGITYRVNPDKPTDRIELGKFGHPSPDPNEITYFDAETGETIVVNTVETDPITGQPLKRSLGVTGPTRLEVEEREIVAADQQLYRDIRLARAGDPAALERLRFAEDSATGRTILSEEGATGRTILGEEGATGRTILGEEGANRRAALQAGVQGFETAAGFIPTPLELSEFERKTLTSPADFAWRAANERGEPSPFSQVTQADIINHFHNLVGGFQGALEDFDPAASFNPSVSAPAVSAPAAGVAPSAPAAGASTNAADAAYDARIKAANDAAIAALAQAGIGQMGAGGINSQNPITRAFQSGFAGGGQPGAAPAGPSGDANIDPITRAYQSGFAAPAGMPSARGGGIFGEPVEVHDNEVVAPIAGGGFAVIPMEKGDLKPRKSAQQGGVFGFENFFNVPGVSAQPNLTQQQIQKFAREFSPPGVRDVFTGQQPAGLRFPISDFQLPSPQLLGALEPEERTAFNTRIGIEGFSPGAVEHSIRQRFGGTRQRPRARQAPRSGF